MSNSLSAVHPELIVEWSDRNLPLTLDNTIRFGKYALFIYIYLYQDLACRLTFRQQMNIINVSGDLPGFIVELTSFECQIAVNESEKVVFKPIQTALMPVKAT